MKAVAPSPCEPVPSRIIVRKARILGDALPEWAQVHGRRFPWREANTTPFALAVAEVLLRRTTSTSAARVFPDLIRRFPTALALAQVEGQILVELLQPVGLQRQRAAQLKAMAQFLLNNHDGIPPQSLSALLAVPGLGEYGARAIRSFAFDFPEAVVDSNVQRILRRVLHRWLGDGASTLCYQHAADCLLNRPRHQAHNFAMLDLGATVCLPKNPRCERCPIRRGCDIGSRR